MDNKLIGGILLIVGTAIGGGMLALPLASAEAGFVNSSLLLFGCWLVMTVGSFLILEVNFWLPTNSNLISMARATLGKTGTAVAWLSYLLLLYSLLAAYIAGGSDFLHNLMVVLLGIDIPAWLNIIIFTGILGLVVFYGIRSVDYVNRGLMLVKFGSLIALIALIIPVTSLQKLMGGEARYVTASLTVMVTSFGFATIVPSLRGYFHDDIAKLRKAIVIGSLIPLFFYIMWDLAVMGVIPLTGENGLIAMLHSGHSNSDFVNTLSNLLQRDTITVLARTFTSVCLATSFLGVALCLSDFLADGLNRSKTNTDGVIVYGATFLPPLLVVLFYPGAFIIGLSYGGISCIILLVLLPALMAWSGRYRKNLAQGYRVKGGKPLLITLMAVAVFIIAQGVTQVVQ